MNGEISHQAKSLLDLRAKKYAALSDVSTDRRIVDAVVVCRVGNQSFGISIGSLEHIVKTPPIAHLPGLPPTILGAVQNNGALLAAVDLSRLFGIDDIGDCSFLAVISHPSGRKLGLPVDEVIGFREVYEDELAERFFGRKSSGKNPVFATTKDLVVLIDVARMFQSDEIVAKRAQGKQRIGEDPHEPA